MNQPCKAIRSTLTALVLTLSNSASAIAVELDNFDINVAQAQAKSVELPSSATGTDGVSRDVLGREAFAWVRRPVGTAAKHAQLGPEAAARAHLGALQSQKRHAVGADYFELRTVDALPGGAQLVQFEPRLDGIEVFREGVALILDREQNLVAMRGPLARSADLQKSSRPAFKLDAAQATRAALRELGVEAVDSVDMASSKAAGNYVNLKFEAPSSKQSGVQAADWARAKRVYFRTASGLQPAWYVETTIAERADAAQRGYAQVISAVDAALLFRVGLTSHMTPFTYKVWAEEGPDFLPQPSAEGRNGVLDPDGLPTNDTVPLVAQASRTLANAPFSRSATDPWLPDNAITTRGNNAWAYSDLVAPDGFSAGDIQPQLTGPFTFDHSFNGAAAESDPTQPPVSAVQAFFIINWLHDWFYDSGFAERDGNAQTDNYGRGGLGGDAILIQTRHYDISNNAFMSTFADGGSPVTSYSFDFDNPPARDRALSGQVVAHEWAHYLSNRLVGNATGLDTRNAGGMGEGWSDFLALLMTLKDADSTLPGNSGYAGGYPMDAFRGHSYYGIRRYPYSTDLTRNPLTLRHIQQDVPLPVTPAPAFGENGSVNASTHPQGEVWASALWDVYIALQNDRPRLDFAEAQRRMKHYLVAGLKMTPVSPTMIEARDAMLSVALADGQQRDFELMAAAFAKRGMGAGAMIPDRYSTTFVGVQESMSVGGHLTATELALGVAVGCDADATLDAGETALISVRLHNSGFLTLSNAAVRLESDDPAIQFPQGNVVQVASLTPVSTVSVSLPVALAAPLSTTETIVLRAEPLADGVGDGAVVPVQQAIVVNLDEALQSSTTQSFAVSLGNWATRTTPADAGADRWSIDGAAGSGFAHGSDTHSNSVIWMESPSIVAGTDPIQLTLRHRYAFETGPEDFFDGGVIQVSGDDGANWASLSAAQAGYPLGLLSDCCGNPLAGSPAFIRQTGGYPNFVDHTINLGTSFSAGARLRVRFGVATDAAVSSFGWDIQSITVTGAANTPFSQIAPQAATCPVQSGKALQGSLSGTYFTPERSGEGVLLDMGQVGGQPVLFFSWYTYEGGVQQWLVGSALYESDERSVAIELIETSGAEFGALFEREDVVERAWGSAALSFPDCQTMDLTYARRDGETGVLRLVRAIDRSTRGTCSALNASRSGTYFSSARSGEGVLVDFGQIGGTPTQFFSWYTYEGGQQQWLVGAQTFAENDDSVTLDLVETRGTGFGNGFHTEDVVELPWGQVTQRFLDCDTLELSYRKADGENGILVMERGLEQQGDGLCQ